MRFSSRLVMRWDDGIVGSVERSPSSYGFDEMPVPAPNSFRSTSYYKKQ
jgi:hypothetical protein